MIQDAQRELLERYGRAAKRYLLGALRDSNAADEVFQEFALRFVRGDLRNADPERGRFRQFLKTVLYHLVADWHKKRHRAAAVVPLPSGLEPPAPDDQRERDEEFIRAWREELLARAWAALEQVEKESGKSPYTVLRARTTHPDWRSQQLAEHLTEQTGREITAGNLRVLVHRAREQFGDLLLAEVIESLDSPSLAELQDELVELRLLEYCRPALERLPPEED